MGKISSKRKEAMTVKRKRSRKSRKKQSRTSSPAHFVCSRVRTRSCTNVEKKRMLVLDSENVKDELLLQANVVTLDPNPPFLSPEKANKPLVGVLNEMKLLKSPATPKTPSYGSESMLESLPMDLLVNILCHLHHDQLKAIFHVSHRLREAVLEARKWHFDYKTPDRTRQAMLSTNTPLATEHWPFESKGFGNYATPKAPRHDAHPPSRLRRADLRQVAVVLFQDPTFSSKKMRPRTLPMPRCKSLRSSRVLYFEELCQAVAQNKLV